mgnify:FL=1
MQGSKASKIVSGIVFISLVLSVIYIIVRIIMVSTGIRDRGDRPESEYVLMLLQCTLGIVMMLLPGIISKKFSIQIPSQMYITFVVFLYCAIYLGEVRSFYYQFRHWDTILHAVSGVMLGALGFSFVLLLNDTEKVPVNISPLFVSLFAFCFSIMLGVMWEFYEFTFDGLLGLNMQKFALEDGTMLVGRQALEDTIKDLFVDTIGALIISVIGYISIKYKKGWIERVLIRREEC